MTKIPSVAERVEEFSIVNDYPVDIGGWTLTYTHQLTEKQKNWLTQTLTSDRLALLTELRECVNQIAYHDDWDCHVLDYDKIKAHLDELIKATVWNTPSQSSYA